MADEVLTVTGASATRRILGIGVFAALGVLLIYIAFTAPPAGVALQAMLIALGVGALWVSERMRRATAVRLELTMQGLRDSDGVVLANTDQMVAIDRGAFAFKPSHGFTLKLAGRAPVAWQPGLYWRFGKRLGVGGVTPGAQTKVMADMIAAMIAEKSGKDLD